jgi:hypothetical protein
MIGCTRTATALILSLGIALSLVSEAAYSAGRRGVPGRTVIEKFTACTGSYDWPFGCDRIVNYRYDCDWYHSHPDTFNAVGRDICEQKHRAYSHRTTGLSSYGGNGCGYTVMDVTCYERQPGYP